MRFACSTVLLPEETDLHRVAELVAAHGYQGIEWRVHPDFHVDPDAVRRLRPLIARATAAAGLDLAAFATYLGPGDPRLPDVVAVAAELGCPRVRLAGFGYDGTIPYRIVVEAARAALGELSHRMRPTGVKAVFELHFGTVHASASGALRLLHDQDPDAVGVILDAANVSVEGNEDWGMVVDALGPYLDHVHVRDMRWVRSADGRWGWAWTPLGEGMVDWPRIVGLLHRHGFAGYLSNENVAGVPYGVPGPVPGRADHDGWIRPLPERLADITILRRLAPVPSTVDGEVEIG